MIDPWPLDLMKFQLRKQMEGNKKLQVIFVGQYKIKGQNERLEGNGLTYEINADLSKYRNW